MSHPDRHAEVLARLSRVSDPELDEAVTELGFITGVEIEGAGLVRIGFRLPTYWCAANFAFMMADDMRREVGALPWVTAVVPRLDDHMYADKINHGVQHALSFAQTFGDAAGGDLDDLRQTFLLKAFQRRQDALLRHLLLVGHAAPTIVAMTRDGLAALPLEAAGARLRARYLERRDLVGAGVLAFVDAEGNGLAADDMPEYVRKLGRVNVNAEFNGALCRGLLAARFDETPAAEPGLRDFVRAAALGRVA